MKNMFKHYVVGWAIVVGLYNLFIFTLPDLFEFVVRYDKNFWPLYVVVMLALIAQLVVAYFAVRKPDKERLFLNLSPIKTTYTATIAIAVIGTAALLIPWQVTYVRYFALLICLVIAGFSGASVVKAHAAAEIVVETGAKVAAQTFTVKMLTADAKGLIAGAGTEEIKAATQKVYEALRYSDPMSNTMLVDSEKEIIETFKMFSNAVVANDEVQVKRSADSLVAMVAARNEKCKLLKG